MAVDNDPENGQFWLTGSQNFELMQGVTESLAGRVAILNLLGLSGKELSGNPELPGPFLPAGEYLTDCAKCSPATGLKEVYQSIWLGGMPALHNPNPPEPGLFFSSYVQTYLQRDVRSLAKVGDETAFYKFLRAAAARTAQMLSYTKLANDAAISVPTAKAWLSILEASGIVYLLQPYHSNVTKRLVKAPKLYFLDTGLAAYLTEWTTPETLEAGAFSGAILETHVVTGILKSYWHNAQRPSIYYYRDKDKKEVDILIQKDGVLYPVEIKKSSAPAKSDVINFGTLGRLGLEVGEGAVVCLCSTHYPLKEGVSVVPVGYI